VKAYVPPQTPYDKVANNQYFKRDFRRSYPQTLVVKNVPGQQVQLLSSSSELAAARPTSVADFTNVEPGQPKFLNYSENLSEYPTITLYK
jgi:hypothetical protein